MDDEKRERLEENGWKVGSASEFLDLDESDETLIELRLALTKRLRQLRTDQGVSQEQLAERLGTSQPRVSKMENVHEAVSLDSLISSLVELGADRREIGRIIAEG
jgi:predicted XRE-type DNA-binding protein